MGSLTYNFTAISTESHFLVSILDDGQTTYRSYLQRLQVESISRGFHSTTERLSCSCTNRKKKQNTKEESNRSNEVRRVLLGKHNGIFFLEVEERFFLSFQKLVLFQLMYHRTLL